MTVLTNFANIGDVILHQRVVNISGMAVSQTRGHDVRGQLMYLPQGFVVVGGFVRSIPETDSLTTMAVGLVEPFVSQGHFVGAQRFLPGTNNICHRFLDLAKSEWSFERDEYLASVTNVGTVASPSQEYLLELNFLLRRLYSG